MLNIQFQPLLDGFNSKQKNDLYFLGTFSSDVEAIDQNNRPKLDLSLVIDRSGSMEGSPLENIKSAVSHFVDQLQPSDKLSVIQYDHEADTIYRRSNLNSVPYFFQFDNAGVASKDRMPASLKLKPAEDKEVPVVSTVLLLRNRP